MQRTPRSENDLISVVLPAYNEAGVLVELAESLCAVLASCCRRYEILFVNDGSTDHSAGILNALAAENPHIGVLHLSRNFGHQAALQAGLDHAQGSAIIVMDSDLQDAPSAIRDFLKYWRAGYDIVYAVRKARKEHPLKRAAFRGFYWLLNRVANIPIPRDAGNFGLIDRCAVDELLRIADRDRFFPGLRSWVGFRQIGIPVERGRRYDDRPRVSVAGLFRLAKSAIVSFSTVPVSIFYLIALMSISASFAMMVFACYHKFFTHLAIPGWASIAIIASFFGALNALGIAILGEYMVRVYDQVRSRPQYIVARRSIPQALSAADGRTPVRREFEEAGFSEEVYNEWQSLFEMSRELARKNANDS